MSERILIIDDSATIQKVIGIAFSRFDVTVVTAASHLEALTEVTKTRPSVILADANLSGTRSLHHFKQLSDLARGVPVILLVGSYETIDEAAYQAAGFHSFLKKPFETSDIIKKISEALGRDLTAEADRVPPPLPPPVPGTARVPPTPVVEQHTRTAPPPSIPFGLPPLPVTPMSFALEPQFPTQNSEPNSKSFFALEPTLTKEREQRPPPEPPPPPATPFEADPARRGRKAFEELRTPSPSPPPRPGANEGLRLGASEPSLPPATTPREDRASLDLLIRSELPGLVRKAVEDYCASHFSQLAREVLLTEIRRLAEEKARHLAD